MKSGIKVMMGLAAVCFVAVTACKNKPEPTPGPDPADKTTVTLDVTAESELLSWSENDQIAVFDGRTATAFTAVSANSNHATFKGEISKAASYYVLAPFDAAATNNGDGITSSLPRVQNAVAGACDPAALLSVGKSADNTAQLFLAGSVLAFSINADNVQKITVSTNSETARISGKAKVTVSSLASTVITGETSVELSGEIKSGNTYYAVIYPGKYENLKVVATNNLGLSATYVANGVKEYPRAALTRFDLNFRDTDWVLETTDGQSYNLAGAQQVSEFSNVNVVSKENVENLTVSGSDVDAACLAQLSKRVASVTGTLTLDAVGAASLAGFADAVQLKGNIVLKNCASLESLAALSAYTTLPGNLEIENCPKALSQPLSFLTGINGDLRLVKIAGLADGSAFAALQNVKGSFELSSCRDVVTFATGIKTVGGDFTIQDNASLAGLNGFDNLERIAMNVVIYNNARLKTLSDEDYLGYCIVREMYNSGVISTEASIKLGTTSAPVDFATLPNCDGILPGEPQNYTIRSKAQMEGFINGLPEGAPREVVNNLTIAGSDITSEQMRLLKGRVAVVKGTITLDSVCNDDYLLNDSNWLETQQIFYNPEDPNGANAIVCEGSVIIRNVSAGINPNGFHGFEKIDGDLIIENCPRFPYWDGWDPFKNLTEVAGDLIFRGMVNGFEGGLLPAINRVGGDFIFDNCGLWYFKGNGIKYIGGDLVIQGCHRLWGLNGFENLTHIGGNVVIWDNHGGDADVSKYGTVDESGNVVWYGYCLLRDLQEAGAIRKNANFKLGSPETGEIRINEINTCAEGDVQTDPDDDTNEGYDSNGNPIDGWQ